MQNNNSKLNTVLLIILIILAAICVWKLVDNDRDIVDDDMEDVLITETDDTDEDEVKTVTETKPVVKTYQYPQTGPAFFTLDAVGNPIISYGSMPTTLIFSGSLGTDTISYSTASQGSFGCIDLDYPTTEKKFGVYTYSTCSYGGNTYFHKSGFENISVLVKTSGANQATPHYANLSTLKFTMEGEN